MKKMISAIFFSLLFAHFGYSIDKGIGVVTLINEQLCIYLSMSVESTIVAEFSVDSSKGWIEYSLSGKDIASNNLVEYGYEELGLPICEVNSNEWVQVMYGYDKNGEMLFGWVNTDENKTEVLMWNSFLKSQLIYFEDPDQIKFYKGINGELIDFELEPSEYLTYDYIMKPMVIEGHWMKVEVVTPSDYCNEPSNPRNKVVWIKFLNNNGRPLVWYFTRGC